MMNPETASASVFMETDVKNSRISICSGKSKIALSPKDALAIGIELIHKSCSFRDAQTTVYEMQSTQFIHQDQCASASE